MSYAEAVLMRAHELNPLNKDHFANLGRLNSYWSRWSGDPTRLRAALDWYEQVNKIAPQDVTLLNEKTSVLVELGNYAATNSDKAQADSYYQQARVALERSRELDSNFTDTYIRLGDLTRQVDKNLDAATDLYVQVIGRDSAALTNSIESIATDLAARPELLMKLRTAYAAAAATQEQTLAALTQTPDGITNPGTLQTQVALLQTITGLLAVRGGDVPSALDPYRRATELQPLNPTYSRNYSIVLSDTMRYADAITETQRLIGQLRGQSGSEKSIADAEQLIALFKRTGGIQ
jgi:tetratricopeptide (TPR) repeat protein